MIVNLWDSWPVIDRRQQIIDTAAELFAERGFHGVSVNDIGAACGISGPALYKHFPSKQASCWPRRSPRSARRCSTRVGASASTAADVAGRRPRRAHRLARRLRADASALSSSFRTGSGRTSTPPPGATSGALQLTLHRHLGRHPRGTAARPRPADGPGHGPGRRSACSTPRRTAPASSRSEMRDLLDRDGAPRARPADRHRSAGDSWIDHSLPSRIGERTNEFHVLADLPSRSTRTTS